MYDVGTGQNQQVAAHDAPIKCVAYIDMPNGSGQNGVLVTAGWDKKLKVGSSRNDAGLRGLFNRQYWNCSGSNPIMSVDLSERAYAMDTADKLLVGRRCYINVGAHEILTR